ncbi:MAG: type II toxin-antitoxin system death-on-curing family toxin [Fibrobacterota bacterium]
MSASTEDCIHLGIDTILEIHRKVIEAFGGATGIRDSALLESAIAAPQASFGGQSVYIDATEIAAAYLFFLCRNHPFIDGNKRVALATCLVFLRLNGYTPAPDSSEWEDLTLDVAASRLDREQTTVRLRSLMA